MDRLKITYQSPAVLQPRATNPRTHSKKQIRQIAASIERFGFNNPVLIDSRGRIVDHCCYAWNQLTDPPWTIMSIGLRD